MAAISPDISSGPYTGNGTQTAFPFTFSIASAGEILVTVDGAAVSPTLYTVSFGDTAGTVAFGSAPASGSAVLLASSPDYVQSSSFETEGAYSLAQVNLINRRAAIRALALKKRVDAINPEGPAQATAAAAVAVTNAAFTAGDRAVTAAAASAAGTSASSAALAAATAGVYPNSAASFVPRGAVAFALTAGSGGSNGTNIAATFSGGNYLGNPSILFDIVSGAVANVRIVTPGLYIGASPTAPTVALPGGAGGATLTLTNGFLVSSGNGYWVQSAGGATLDRYKNVAGVAVQDSSIRSIELATGPAWASVRCPAENGEDPTSQVDSGGLYLPNTNNIFKTSVANDTPFFATASAFAVMCSVPTKCHDVTNRVNPMIVGTDRTASNPRAFFLSYVAGGDVNNQSNANKFVAYFAGEGGAGSVSVYGATMPATFSGLAMVIARNLGSTVRIDVIDLQTQLMTTGTAVALPGAWAGIAILTNNIGLGVNEDGTFPQSSPYGAQLNSYWKGEFANFMMVDGSTTDTQWQNIAAGADIASTIGAGNFRLWAKCAGNGVLDTSVSSNKAALTNGFVQRGVLHPGSTLCRQATAAYLTIDRLGDPAFVSVVYGADGGDVQLNGRFAGVTGRLQYRLYQADKPLTAWIYLCDVPGSGSVWSARAKLPLSHSGEPYHLAVRATSAGSPIALFNTELWCGYAISLVGQSQLWYTISQGVAPDGIGPTPLNLRFDGGAARGVFVTRRVDVGTIKFGVQRFACRPQYAGDGLITQINYIRARTKVPLMFLEHAVTGTACIDLMDDSLTVRQWVDFKTVGQTALANRDSAGRMVLTGLVYYWATSDPSTAYGAQIWRPFIFGMQSVAQSGYYIAQSHISHFLMDGVDFNPSIKLVCAPYGREAAATTPQTTDRGTQADIRASQRADMAAYGFVSGPESTIFKFENNLVYGAHPDPTSANGVPTMARAIAEADCIAIGVGTYRGRATVAGAAFTDGTRTAIRVTFTGPPGGRLAPFTVGTTDIRGHEVQDGGSGAWTKATHTAVIETPQSVVLTKASGAWSVGTKVSYHSGSPGGYGEDDAAWIAGSLIWEGWPVAGDNSAYTAT